MLQKLKKKFKICTAAIAVFSDKARKTLFQVLLMRRNGAWNLLIIYVYYILKNKYTSHQG